MHLLIRVIRFLAGFSNDIDRTLLGFQVGLCQVFTDDSKAQKLHAAKQRYEAGERRPSADGVTPNECFDQDDDESQNGDETEDDTREGGEGERRRGKSDDAVDGIEEQRPKAPLGLAGHAVDVYIGEPFGLEAHPAVNALGESVIFAHGDDSVDHGALHEPKVACTVDDVRVGNAVDDLVEHAGEERPDGRLAFAGGPARSDVVVVFGLQDLVHLRQQRGRVLHVGVHGGDIVTLCMLESGKQCRLLAKVA